MKLRTLLLVLALLPFCCPLQGGVWDNIKGYFNGNTRPEAPTIRVLLLHDVEKSGLEVQGKYSLYDPYTNAHISTRFSGKSRTIQAASDGLRWGEAFPGLYQLKIKPDDEEAAQTKINGRDYAGEIYVYDIGGTISIVNQISVEEYVRSVLLEYKNQNLAPEVLAALAIAARTKAYFQAANPKNTFWAVDAEKVGYLGHLPSAKPIDDAVRVTRYMIMSRTGVYEGVATPFASQFNPAGGGQAAKDVEVSQISLEEANAMAKKGDHADQILAKAFPGMTIMLMQYSN